MRVPNAPLRSRAQRSVSDALFKGVHHSVECGRYFQIIMVFVFVSESDSKPDGGNYGERRTLSTALQMFSG